MTHTQAVVFVAMLALVTFIYGAILWQREQVIDRLADDLEALEREVGLLLGRERSRDEYLGIEVSDPVPDGPDDFDRFSEPYGGLAADDKPQPANADTDEFPLPDPFPATQPDLKAAASVGPLPSVDAEWETRRQEIEAEWQKRAAEIGGGR